MISILTLVIGYFFGCAVTIATIAFYDSIGDGENEGE